MVTLYHNIPIDIILVIITRAYFVDLFVIYSSNWIPGVSWHTNRFVQFNAVILYKLLIKLYLQIIIYSSN